MLNSSILKLDSPIAVVCHDAGATNLILGWLQTYAINNVQAYFQGPAHSLWGRIFPQIPLCASLEDALSGASTLISGTGWASNLEHHARQLAHVRGIKSIAVLDHWVNYPMRFQRDGKLQLPNEVWVADTHAFFLAQEALPGLHVRQLNNSYLDEQVAKIKSPPGDGTLLVILEPVRETWGGDRNGEFQALDYFFTNLNRIWPTGLNRIILRRHPSEPLGKYDAWLSTHSMASMDTSLDIATAISQADVVAGLESFALTVALAAGRPVYSILPPWAPSIRLPHVEIQEIRHLTRL